MSVCASDCRVDQVLSCFVELRLSRFSLLQRDVRVPKCRWGEAEAQGESFGCQGRLSQEKEEAAPSGVVSDWA